MLTKYLNYIKFEKRYADHTYISYKTDLDQFQAFLQLNYTSSAIEKAHHKQIRAWIVQLMDNGVSPRTINRKLSSLKGFFRFLQKRSFIDLNPMQKVISPKVAKRLPKYFRERTMQDLFQKVDFGNSFEGLRDRLILAVLYQTGMRRAELLSLKISDINFSQCLFSVVGKGSKHRFIPFTFPLKNEIQQYLKVREKVNINHLPFLFLTSKGQALYPKLIYRITNKYLSYVSTQDKKSPHTIRHSFATHLSDHGAELNAIKELLGHSNLAATQIYTHNSIEKLKSAYLKAHPKSL